MILLTVQGANWQRAGGKGDKPKLIKRPTEKSRNAVTSAADLAARKRKLKKQREETHGD